MRDMIQSHFLNMAFKLIVDPESEFLNVQISKYLNAQYDGYKQELGRESETETFVDLEFATPNHQYHFMTGRKFSKREAYIDIDGEKLDLDIGSNPYEAIFENFLAPRSSRSEVGFANIDNALLAWKIIKKIEESRPPVT